MHNPMNKYCPVFCCNYSLQASGWSNWRCKMHLEQLDQTANWVSTYMITSDDLTIGHIPLPPSNDLFNLGFHPWWLVACVFVGVQCHICRFWQYVCVCVLKYVLNFLLHLLLNSWSTFCSIWVSSPQAAAWGMFCWGLKAGSSSPNVCGAPSPQ